MPIFYKRILGGLSPGLNDVPVYLRDKETEFFTFHRFIMRFSQY